MPVYDYSYKVWEGERRGALFRWLTIPKYAYMELLKLRIFTGLLTASGMHMLLFIAYIYLLVNVDILKLLQVPKDLLRPIDATFFKLAIDIEFFPCLILAFVMGANLIARDLKHGALVLYVSKPINRWEYFLGKSSVLFFIFLLLLWVLPMILYTLQVAMAQENTPWRLYFWRDYAWIFGAITLYALIVAITLSLIMLASSSLTKNARYAGIIFVVFLIGTWIIGPIMGEVMRNNNYYAISPILGVVNLGSHIFRQDSPTNKLDISAFWAWASILFYWSASGLILKRQIDKGAQYGR